MGKKLTYDRLLIATGARAVRMDVPGANLEGVVVLDNLDDARRIIKSARRTRSAVVIGGGITALEIVEGLVSRGVKTHYFLRGERYWSNVLDETESGIVWNACGMRVFIFTIIPNWQKSSKNAASSRSDY